MRLAVLQGPNLNLLGTREPDRYGSTTLLELQHDLDGVARELQVSVEHHQSNHEGVLIDTLHDLASRCSGVLINPGGLGHTSVSLRDALLAIRRPFVEVHLTNIHAREPFRHRTLLSDVAVGTIAGFGPLSYALGLRGLVSHLRTPSGAEP